MQWHEQYTKENEPMREDMSSCINMPAWNELLGWIEGISGKLKTAYSACSMQRGWNVKCTKKGKSLATLYPQNGYFKALIVLPDRMVGAIEPLLPAMSERVQGAYRQTPSSMGGRWLMLEARDERVAEDIRTLIKAKADAL